MIVFLANIVMPMIVPTIGSAIAAFLTYELHKLFSMIKSKISASHNLEAINGALTRIEKFAQQAVLATEQTTVDTLKKNGKWNTPEAYETAAKASLEMLKTMTIAEIPALVQTGYNDIDGMLRTFIEAAVKKYTNRNTP